MSSKNVPNLLKGREQNVRIEMPAAFKSLLRMFNRFTVYHVFKLLIFGIYVFTRLVSLCVLCLFTFFKQERINKTIQSKLQVYGRLVQRLGLETELRVFLINFLNYSRAYY